MPRCIETEEQKQQYKFIIQCLAEGDTYVDIGQKIGLSTHSAKHKISYMLKRYNARNKAHLVSMAFRKGVIS